MLVICLFPMLIYSPTKSPQSLLFYFFSQIELFKSSGDLKKIYIYIYIHIAVYIAEIQNISM